ncbi:hypothetical protein GHV40_14370 [Devosia sp. D6-9]|nr:hypothetical protein GHV40_14370 [Devosia sp. D6-9]
MKRDAGRAAYVAPDFGALERSEAKANFTSRKLDVLSAVAQDPRVSSGEFRVFFLLVQYARSSDGTMYPAQDRIALQMGAKPRWVRACIDGLVKKGWLSKSRPNRQRTNIYRVEMRNVNAIIDRITSLLDQRAETINAKSDRHKNVSQERSDRHNSASPERHDRASKHLSRTPEYMGMDKRDSQYSTEGGEP